MNMREKKNRTLSPVECFGGRWPAANNNRTNIDGIESMLELHDLQHIWRIWIWITCNFYPFSFFISVCFAFFILLSILNFNVIVFDRQCWDRQSPIHTHLWRFHERSYWQPLIIHFFFAFVLLAIHTTQHTQIQRSQRRRSNKTTNDTVADVKQTQIIKKCSTFGSFIFVGHLAFSLLLTHPNCDAPRWSIYIYIWVTRQPWQRFHFRHTLAMQPLNGSFVERRLYNIYRREWRMVKDMNMHMTIMIHEWDFWFRHVFVLSLLMRHWRIDWSQEKEKERGKYAAWTLELRTQTSRTEESNRERGRGKHSIHD